jgi:signal transduction histidine kinase
VAAQADGARYQIRADPARAEEALEVIGQTARSAMLDVRSLLTRLRERRELEVGLTLGSSEDVMARMRASGMALELSRRGEPPLHQGDAVLVTARLALAEALTNALKHGDLTRSVTVDEDWTAGYLLRVVNAVTDIVAVRRAGTTRPGTGDGHGLLGMTERVSELGGRVDAGPEAGSDGGRWVTEVTIPGEAP